MSKAASHSDPGAIILDVIALGRVNTCVDVIVGAPLYLNYSSISQSL